MRVPSLGVQLALAFVLSLLFLTGLIGWLENVHILTTNGMYKSIQAEPWIADPAHARLDASNYLYFPLYGRLAHLLDMAGILRGMAWRQFAYLNAFWASLVVVFVYAFVHRLTGSARVAALAALFHLGCGTVLGLAVINEDIMPGYAVLLASMLMAGLWFDRPTYPRVVLVAIVFTLGWMIEWRLIFPTLPAFLLALALADLPLRRRAALIATLLASIFAVTIVMQLLWNGHPGSAGVFDLLWTGKGIESGWGGLGWDKAWMMLGGVGNYLVIAGNYADPQAARADAGILAILWLAQFAIFVAAVAISWPRRADLRLRAVVFVFLGTLAAGQVMNFYSQPHDPQMQVNVMPWLTVAWALILSFAVERRRAGLVLALAALSLVPVVMNVASLSRWRGDDSRAVAGLANLEKHFPTDRTVFVFWGFEPVTTWGFALWSHTWDFDAVPLTSSAPSDNPRFKWIAVNAGAIRHPRWTPEEDAASLRRQIETAFDRGYRVAISAVWTSNVDSLAGGLGALSAAGRAPALYAVLHDGYTATPVFQDPTAGAYYELKRK